MEKIIQMTSPQARDSGQSFEGVYVTPEIAKQNGIAYRKEPPTAETCMFCGKHLDPEGLALFGKVMGWRIHPCECEQAIADRERKERNKQREEEFKQKQLDESLRRARLKDMVEKSGIKKRFAQRTFENFQQDTAGRKKAYSIAKKYADTFDERQQAGTGLYLEGSNGTGKTHLAVAIALQLIGQHRSVICKTSIDMLEDIKSAFGYNEDDRVLNRYKRAELLVIDDLGKEQITDWSATTLYSILNDRYEDMRPTIITTNFNEKDLMQHLTVKGETITRAAAMLSRLHETSIAVPMHWDDWRGRNG